MSLYLLQTREYRITSCYMDSIELGIYQYKQKRHG
jgi:hypothetical protein